MIRWTKPLSFVCVLGSCAPRTETQPITEPGLPSASSSTEVQVTQSPPSPCGNQQTEEGETCDDGNTVAGDGCSPRCRREPVAFTDGRLWTLADGTIVTWNHFTGEQPRIYPAKARVAQPGGLVLDGWDNQVTPSSSYLPVELLRRAVLVDGNRSSACVAIDSGEIWCTPPSNSYTECTMHPALDGGIWLTKRDHTKVLWCRVKRPPGPVKALDDGCAVENDGRLFCWNAPLDEQYPLGNRRLAGFGADWGHYCALSVEGEVGCWGEAAAGQLGYMGEHWFNEGDDESPDEEGFHHWTPPTQFMRFPSPAKAIDVTGLSACAILENKQVWCWGNVYARFQGKGTEPFETRLMAPESTPKRPVYKKPGESTLPDAPIELPPVCNLEAFSHECALCSPGCWKCLDPDTDPKDEKCIEF